MIFRLPRVSPSAPLRGARCLLLSWFPSPPAPLGLLTSYLFSALRVAQNVFCSARRRLKLPSAEHASPPNKGWMGNGGIPGTAGLLGNMF